MNCLTPYFVDAKKTWKTQGWLPVPCGKCINCRSRRRLDWTFRLNQEMQDSHYTAFATLTYSEKNLPTCSSQLPLDSDDSITIDDIPTLDYSDVQKFLKVFRFHLDKLAKIKLRYFICGEYGTNTLRPHYHAIFFFTSSERSNTLSSVPYFPQIFRNSWKLGDILDFQQLSGDGASSYCNKYLQKFYKLELLENQNVEKSLKSQGIGKGYLNRFSEWHLADPDNRLFCYFQGRKIPLPRYYFNKLFPHSKLPDYAAAALIDDSKKQMLQKIANARRNYMLLHNGSDLGFENQFTEKGLIEQLDYYNHYLELLQSNDKF